MTIARLNTLPIGHKDLSRRAILGGLALSISPMAHMPLRIATDTVAISR